MTRPTSRPVLLRDVFDDPTHVVRLLERGAPYTPLGGWMRPGLDPDAPTSVMWFQEDWVHAEFRLPGAELFLDHPAYFEAARRFWGMHEIVPHSVYVNLMVNLCEAGPAHSDNPKFRGRERSNTPMWNFGRSEEHTSELQSLRHLVCRLLLEKKKKKKKHIK